MKAVILCGGYGTRIRDVTSEIPKPMIPIGNYPILWHIMKHLSFYGIKEFVLCLGYKSEAIKDYFLNYQHRRIDFTVNLTSQEVIKHTQHQDEDWSITFAETGLESLTGARIKKILPYVANEDDFLLTYGDGVSNINIENLLSFHKSHGKLLTVTGAHPPGRFGELEISGHQVTGFNEKPQSTEGWISAGYFVCNKSIFHYLNDDLNLIFENDPINRIVKDGHLMAYKHSGFWHPMDTSRDYHLLNDLWKSPNAPWKIWG
ncbi:MAG: glucose-1-phosphate cytidylyltransferase [Candidatus Paracaedibacter sp.]